MNLPDWYDDALCAQVDPELWFPVKGGDYGSSRIARQVCAGCPVAVPCLTYALEHDIGSGIWGGTTPAQRKRAKRGAA